MFRRLRIVFLMVVSFLSLVCSAASRNCTFEDLEPVVIANQTLLYEGYIDQALRAWEEEVKRNPCTLVKAYRVNTLFWQLMIQKVNDELNDQAVERFLRISEWIKKEAEQKNPEEITNPADAFAYAWVHMVRAQWYGFNRKWLSMPGDIKAGYRWLMRAAELAPERPEVMYYQGVFHYLLDRRGLVYKLVRWVFSMPTGDRDKAWPLLEAASRANSGLKTEIDMVRAAFYQQEGLWTQALDVIHRIRQRHPWNPMFHLWEGLFYERVAGDYEEAFRIYQSVAQRCRDSKDPRYNRWVEAQALHRMGHTAYHRYRFNESLGYFEELLTGEYRDPPWVIPKTLLVMGDLYRDWGQIEKAREMYARVMQYPPVLDYRERAARGMHGDYDSRAWQDYQEYVKGKVDLAEGRIKKGCEHFASAIKRKRTPLMMLGWAECLSVSGDKDRALEILTGILKMKKGVNLVRARASAAIFMADLHAKEQEKRTALRLYMLARSMDHAPGELIQKARYQVHRLMNGG